MPSRPSRLRLDWLEERTVPTAEIEPNNTTSTATSFQNTTDSLTGTISAATDVDYFKTNLSQGDVLTVTLNDLPGNVRVAPALEILNPQLQVVAGSLDGRVTTIVAPAAGTYRLRLFPDQVLGTFTGSYTVQTVVTAFSGTSESEPNDTSATATAIGT